MADRPGRDHFKARSDAESVQLTEDVADTAKIQKTERETERLIYITPPKQMNITDGVMGKGFAKAATKVSPIKIAVKDNTEKSFCGRSFDVTHLNLSGASI